MTLTRPIHLRFIGARVYCSVVGTRVRLGRDHRYGEAFECPGCGETVTATRQDNFQAGNLASEPGSQVSLPTVDAATGERQS